MQIHLVGIGGVAMGNLGAMLQRTGHTVTGSDQALYPPMSDRLRDWGITAKEYAKTNIGASDLYIIGNALSRGNPEVEEILNQNLPYMSMSAALSRFFLEGREVFVVAGTHGKTTTTFLVDHLLSASGKPPGLFAGGVRADGTDGFRVSDSKYFVIEGDEYDTAFFDKGSKFLHYRPRTLILTSIEYDHADIFPDTESYLTTFRRLLRLVPAKGLVIACKEDEGVREVLKGYDLAPIQWYDKSSFQKKDAALEISDIGKVSRFPLAGDHNALNACAAVLAAKAAGLADDRIRFALGSFPGVLRRQQLRVDIQVPTRRLSGKKPEKGGVDFVHVALVEDFAHHPTAVRETIAAVKDAYKGRRMSVLFEPRSASSHRDVFRKDYVKAFRAADDVYICDVYNREKVDKKQLLDVRRMIKDLTALKKSKKSPAGKAIFGKHPADLAKQFQKTFKPSPSGDVVLMMSNGAFGGIYKDVEEFLKAFGNPR